MARLLLTGIVMIPAGGLLIVMALHEEGVFPQGIWQGPIVSGLGVVLVVLSIREMLKPAEPLVSPVSSNSPPIPNLDFGAARRLATDAIRRTIEEILPCEFPNESVYVIALSTPDDADQTQAFAFTTERLADCLDDSATDGERALAKWYAGEWGDDLLHISFQEVEQILALDSYDDDSHESFSEFKARRLWVMTKALKDVADSGLFDRFTPPITAFCTVFDDSDAVWLERETARHINPPYRFQTFAFEQALAAVEWYGDKPDEPGQLAPILRRLLQEDLI